jgi:hypothetical protein
MLVKEGTRGLGRAFLRLIVYGIEAIRLNDLI